MAVELVLSVLNKGPWSLIVLTVLYSVNRDTVADRWWQRIDNKYQQLIGSNILQQHRQLNLLLFVEGL